MKTLVLGGSGFIGRMLAATLLDAGHEVVVVGRSPQRAARRFAERQTPLLRFAAWDGRSAQGWGAELEGAHAVVNLAGANIAAGRWTAAQKQRILESRLSAGQAVCQAFAQAQNRPQVLLQASAVGYYGLRGDEEVHEDTPPLGGSFLATTAAAWEKSTDAVEALGVRRVLLRTGVVLGRGGGALRQMTTPFKFFVGGTLGSGKQWVSWIHIRDEVGAMLHLLRTPSAQGPFNLVAPNPATMKQLARAIGKAMGRPALLPAPACALRLVLGRMADELLLSGQRVSARRLLESGYVFAFPHLEQTLRDLL